MSDAPEQPTNTQPEDSDSNPEDWSGTVADRRLRPDRRDERDEIGCERRRGPGRRRTDFTKSAEEGEMTKEQFLFLVAIDAFKRVNGKTFPTWTDVLEIIRRLGYRKVQPSTLNLAQAEDWVERPDTPIEPPNTRPGDEDAFEDDAFDEAA
ncbi:MAG: hypothetical protein ACF8PN_01440 [Phycisphaerales bacterium]